MNELTKSLDDTLFFSTTKEITNVVGDSYTDLVESGIDTLIKDTITKEIPIIRTLVMIPKITKIVSNYLLLQKVARFLFRLNTTSLEERQHFLLSLDSKKRDEIVSNLILVLDRHEHLDKSDLQGKLFSAYIKGGLHYEDYMALTHSLNAMDVKLLPSLALFYTLETSHTLTPETLYHLVFLRLIRIDNSSIGTWGGGGPKYEKNRLGMLMCEICSETKIPEDYKNKILGKDR